MDIETTKSPFSRNSPLLLDKAVDEKRKLGEVLPLTSCAGNQKAKNVGWQGLAEDWGLLSQTTSSQSWFAVC